MRDEEVKTEGKEGTEPATLCDLLRHVIQRLAQLSNELFAPDVGWMGRLHSELTELRQHGNKRERQRLADHELLRGHLQSMRGNFEQHVQQEHRWHAEMDSWTQEMSQRVQSLEDRASGRKS